MNELDFIRPLLPAGMEETFLTRCKVLEDFLYETNRTLNLTRIPETEFMSKHAADSLAAAAVLKLTQGKNLCDVGCGAGFPSLILAAAFPEIKITAVDSTRKKVDFVQAAADKMGLANLRTCHARANELGRKPEFHEQFDIVTARAVSNSPDLITETAGLLKKGGILCVFRTPSQFEEEFPILKKKKVVFETTQTFELPGNAGTRLFLLIRKQGKAS